MRTTAIRFASSLLLLVSTEALCCTTAVVSAEASGTGRPMIWKQRDAGDDYNHLAFVQGEKYGFTALFPTADTGNRKAYAGINEAGFAIANNLSYNVRPDSLGFGDTRNGEWMTRALGCCRTVGDFESMLVAEAYPMHLSSNFAVIDAFGGAAYFEVSDTAYVRFDVPPGGYLFRTNYSLSGDPERGRGFARYATMERQMAAQLRRGFTPAFFLETGRTFRNVLTGDDALQTVDGDYLYEHDFIPRGTTTASVVIEGVALGGAADSGLLWCAPGYTPCSYAVPVWVAAGERIPAMLSGEAPANRLAVALKRSIRPLDWDNKYLYVKSLRAILKEVRKAERTELRAGRRLKADMDRSGFDPAAVERYNTEAALRFDRFRERMGLDDETL
jgi:hypothetical protein